MFRKQIFFRHYEDAWQKVFISTQDKYCACNANERNEEKTAVSEAKPISLLDVRGRLAQLWNRKTPVCQVVKMVRADRRA